MSKFARIAAVALGLVALALTASAEVDRDEDGFTPLDAVDTGKTEALEDVDTGRTEKLDSVDTGRTETLDSVDTGRTETLESVDDGRTETLDSVDAAPMRSLDQAEADRGAWQPPPCSSVEIALDDLPDAADSQAWGDILREAQQQIQTSKRELDQADSAYARAMNSHAVGSRREAIVQTRDDARTQYGRDRCALPELLERARRAGVAPGVTRRYQESSASSD